MNNVQLLGRICNDLEIKRAQNGGKEILPFTIAVRKNEEDTNFIDCVAFGKTAQFIDRYFYKGRTIAVNGAIDVSNFTDKDGHKRKSVKVLINQAYFCGDKGTSAPTQTEPQSIDISADDELPF